MYIYPKLTSGKNENSTTPNADSSPRGEAVRFDGIRFKDVKWETVNLSASEGPDSVNGTSGNNQLIKEKYQLNQN
jgi:hypothetical protein